jgi:hypothetical protein
MNFNGNITFRTLGKGELQNAIIERLSSAPTGEDGRIYFNTTDKKYYYYGVSGSPSAPAWVPFATGGDAASIQAELDLTQLSMGYINANGSFDVTAFSGFGNVSGSPLADLVDVLASMDTSITANASTISSLTAADITFAPAGDIIATDVQAAIVELDDEKVNISGDTMTGDLTMATGFNVNIPQFPINPLEAANKAYVDQIASNISWRNPIEDADLIDIVAAEPAIAGTFGDTVTYIKQGGTQGETWGGFGGSPVIGAVTNIVDGDYLSFRILSTGSPVVGTWRRLGNLTDGVRFIIAAEHGTAGSGILALGFLDGDLIQYESSGSPNEWLQPEGAVGPGSPEIPNGTTVNVSNVLSYHAGHTYSYDATNNAWVEIGGPASIVAGVGLAYDGNILNVQMGAGIIELPSDEVGIDLYDASTGAIILTSDGSTRSATAATQLHLLLSPGGFLSQDATGLAASLTLNDLSDVTSDNTPGDVLVTGTGSPAPYSTQAIQFNYDSTLNGGAALTHTVTHNLGQQFVNVTVYKQEGSPLAYSQIIPQSVVLDSSTQLTVTFTAAIQCVIVASGVPGVGLA